jgi:hypothetical protein
MRQRLKSACTHIEAWTAEPLVIDPGPELLLPLALIWSSSMPEPQILSAAPKGGGCGGMKP